MANARELALQTLTDILVNQAYSNHALNDKIEKNDLISIKMKQGSIKAFVKEVE